MYLSHPPIPSSGTCLPCHFSCSGRPPRRAGVGPNVLSLVLALVISLVLPGCSTSDDEEEKLPAIAGLTIHPPSSDDDWRSIRTDYSQFYITTRDELYDEDLIALFVEVVPLMRPVKDERELLAYIQNSPGPARADVTVDSLMGKEVLLFHTAAQRVENPARFRQLFRLKPRLADAVYIKRSKGILFRHPTNDSQAIRIGIWRNSYHGQIGEYFESIATDFASSFLVANGLVTELR